MKSQARDQIRLISGNRHKSTSNNCHPCFHFQVTFCSNISFDKMCIISRTFKMLPNVLDKKCSKITCNALFYFKLKYELKKPLAEYLKESTRIQT